METKLTNLKDNLVSIEFTIPAKEATNAYNTAASQISQRVNIDGFRKGKAPRAVIERHVGVDRIQQGALEILLPKYLNQAIHDNNLDVITQPAITDYKFETGKDVAITFQVETKPEVILGAYKDLNVEVNIPQEDKTAFDNALNNYLNQHSSLDLVLDRPSCNTDIVVIDFDGKCNGEEIKGGSSRNHMLDLAHSDLIPGFAEQLVGHNIKDEFDINVTFPENYHDEKLKGQPAVFSIKMKEIKQRIVPELTDELVSKTTQFKTVDELKADIKKYIDTQWENLKKVNAENTLFKSVSDNTTVDIPQGMIDREVASLRAEYQQRLSYQGVDWNSFIQAQGEEFNKNLVTDATIRIKNSLIIDKISREINVKVEQSDFQEKITQMAGAYGVQPQALVKQFNQNPNFISSISQQIVNEKVRDYLLNNNKVVYVEMKQEENKEAVEA